MISESTKEYLMAIYILSKNSKIRVTDVAKFLNCSKPSVSKQLNILSEKGYIVYNKYKDIELTSKGIEEAKITLESYNILYLLMKDIFNIDNEDIDEEIKKLKSCLSTNTLSKIAKYVYKELGLKNDICDYNINKEKCRMCFTALRSGKDVRN